MPFFEKKKLFTRLQRLVEEEKDFLKSCARANQRSFDCHSFVIELLCQSKVNLPTFPHPNLHFPYEKSPAETKSLLYAWAKEPEGKEYLNQLQRVHDTIWQNSTRYPLPRRDELTLESAEEIVQPLIERLEERFQKKSSRWICLTQYYPKKKKRDFIHSALLLNNEIVIEKQGIGRTPTTSSLKDMLVSRMLDTEYIQPCVHILNKPAREYF